MHLLTWAVERSGAGWRGGRRRSWQARKGGRKEGRRGSKKLCWRGEGEEKWKPESGIKRLKGRNGERERERERADAFRAGGRQAKVNPWRENHFTAVTETTEWCGRGVDAGRGKAEYYPIPALPFQSVATQTLSISVCLKFAGSDSGRCGH